MIDVALNAAPFGRAPDVMAVPDGTLVRAMLLEAVRCDRLSLDDLNRAVLYIDGEAIPREDSLDRRLVAGQVVNLAVEPLGGGGGGGRKNVLQVVLMIAVVAASAWVGASGAVAAMLGSQLAARVAAAAIMAVGSAAVRALTAPDRPGAGAANDRYALQSAQNQYRPWAPFPLALGEVVVAPDLAVKTFTQADGEDVWIHGVLGLHNGPCQVSELKIGDTLASSMGEGDARFVHHLTPGPRTFSLYPNDVDQLDLQEELIATTGAATPVVRAASSDGERFDFDLYLPEGLYFQKDDGRVIAASVTITIRRRPIDAGGAPTGPWAAALTIPLTSSARDPMRVTRSVALPLGRYEFEVVRSLLPDDNEKRHDGVYLTAIKAVAFRKPVADETLSLIEFAVRATAVNQGSLAPITCRLVPLCPTWTGSAWSAPVPTSNPAALVRWLLTGPASAVPISTAQADVRLRAWSALCETYDWSCHLYLTDDSKQDAVLIQLGVAGRASLFWDGTQIAAAPWVEKPAPRQLFAGANLQDHRWSLVYLDPVHALRVEFNNLDEAGEPDQIHVYADGYAETAGPGVAAASLVEAYRLDGQTTEGRAWREGRWELGRRKHQRRVDSWSADIENLTSQFGDRVRLAWTRVDGGIGARVRCRRWSTDGSQVVGLRLDQPVRMEAGETYAADLRLLAGVQAAVPLITVAGDSREIRFVTPRSPALTPEAGGRIAFGVAGRVSEDVEIIAIEPGEGQTARLTGIRYVAPLLMAGETGPIPDLPHRLSRDRAMDPPAPSLLGVQIDANGVRAGFSMPPWRGSPITGYGVRWRTAPEAGQTVSWIPLPDLGAAALTVSTPALRELPAVATNATSVQIEIRALTASGRVSQPLLIEAALPTVAAPLSADWTVTPSPPASDGNQQATFDILGLVASDRVARVQVEYGPAYGPGVDGPWTAVFDGPATDGKVRTGFAVLSGATVSIAVTHWSPSGVPSPRTVIGTYTAPTATGGGGGGSGPTVGYVSIIGSAPSGTTYVVLGSADVSAFVSGSLVEGAVEVTSSGAFADPGDSYSGSIKVTAQLVSGGAETTIFEGPLTGSNSGLGLPGGGYMADWSGPAGQAFVALTGAVRLRMYGLRDSGVNPGAGLRALLSISPPAT